MILQRYTFGSKSQHKIQQTALQQVAYDIAKIYIWKQITTAISVASSTCRLLMILQRYTFGSKSQPANMNLSLSNVAYDIAKIYIWKQITTYNGTELTDQVLLMILQRYTFGSKSQL